jgi:hypothetical protein
MGLNALATFPGLVTFIVAVLTLAGRPTMPVPTCASATRA